MPTALVEPLCAPVTVPGAGDTNPTIVLDLERELGLQEPARCCGTFLWEHSWGSRFRPQGRGQQREDELRGSCCLLVAELKALQAEGILARWSSEPL